jgi:hypothetical protein
MDNLLLEIGGKELYLDVDRLSEIVRIENETPTNEMIETEEEDNEVPVNEVGMHIDVTKYELYRELINALMMYTEEVDDKMGFVGLNRATIPFKIAFNTLLMKGILKEL